MKHAELVELEVQLRNSHTEEALELIKTFSESLGKTRRRLEVFNADYAIVRPPISQEEAQALGYDKPDDEFVLLQGDIVTTDNAFYLGERVVGNPKYLILSSSCDLVPQRRECAALLRISEIRRDEQNVGAKLNLLLRYLRTDLMYLPPLGNDPQDTVCNSVRFDGICQIRSTDLMLANRIASLSLVGWRVFAAFSRVIIARTSEREISMRRDVDNMAEQILL